MWVREAKGSVEIITVALVSALTLGGVPDVEAAHLRAAATHDRAALLHEEAAELFEMMGLPSLARGERARARLDREGAATELESAHVSHDLASAAVTGAPEESARLEPGAPPTG